MEPIVHENEFPPSTKAATFGHTGPTDGWAARGADDVTGQARLGLCSVLTIWQTFKRAYRCE